MRSSARTFKAPKHFWLETITTWPTSTTSFQSIFCYVREEIRSRVVFICLYHFLSKDINQSLNSNTQVSVSTWEEGSTQLSQDYSVFIDPSSAIMRNPFSEKRWRKFQISRLFSSSNAAVKLHVIDVNLFQRGTRFVDRWLVVLSLGSGQTRNMALDRYAESKLFLCHYSVIDQ